MRRSILITALAAPILLSGCSFGSEPPPRTFELEGRASYGPVSNTAPAPLAGPLAGALPGGPR